MILGVILLVIAAAQHRAGWAWAVGGLGGALLGVRSGTAWGLFRLGEWERRQRNSRIRNWRRG